MFKLFIYAILLITLLGTVSCTENTDTEDPCSDGGDGGDGGDGEEDCTKEPKCPKNEVYNDCPRINCDAEYCPNSRDAPPSSPVGTKCGTPRCTCAFNTRRDRKTGRCIPTTSCPPFACYRTNEEYKPCPPKCPTDKCSDHVKNVTCGGPLGTRIGIVLPCEPQCRCKEGFYRNDDGACVEPKDCPEQCPKNQVFSFCIQAECRPLNCTQLGKRVPCPRLDPRFCIRGCICAQGYLRDKNGNCVPENNCENNETEDPCPDGAGDSGDGENGNTKDPKCPKNEVYNKCPGINCDAEYCPKSRDAPPSSPVGTKCGTARCTCAFNTRRDRKSGRCIPTTSCPPFACNRTNEEYKPCPPKCPTDKCSDHVKNVTCGGPLGTRIGIVLPCEPQCRCKEGFYRNDDGACVEPKDCPEHCPKDQVFSFCIQAECRPLNCTQLGKRVPCPRLDPRFCIRGCICAQGYLRDKNGNCVPENKCQNDETEDPCPDGGGDGGDGGDGENGNTKDPTCPKYEEYNKCPRIKCDAEYCPKSRDTPLSCSVGTKCGTPRCTCAFNTRRDRKTGRCIPTKSCPPFACNRTNEEYKPCPPKCPTDKCSDHVKNVTCGGPLGTRIGIVLPCEPQCRCKEGFYRNDDGACVEPKDCPEQCPKNQVFSFCIQAECRPLNCTQLGQRVPCPRLDPRFCIRGCICAQGYLRDKNGNCVPENKCPPPCTGPHEVYDPCQRICSPQTCDSMDQKLFCPRQPVLGSPSCRGTCKCKTNYFRNAENVCVSKKDCLKCKRANEVYDTCASTCPETCDSIGKKYNCPLQPLPGDPKCQAKCRCEKGYFRNSTGDCVPESECKKCPENEIYNECPAVKCGAEYCPQSRTDPQSCPVGFACDPPRCTCAFNRHRDRHTGKCILTSDCPPFPCDGPNEKYVPCPPVCPGEKCSDYINNSTCPKYRIGIVVPCKPQCKCNKGYYRDKNNVCVSAKQCLTNDHGGDCDETKYEKGNSDENIDEGDNSKGTDKEKVKGDFDKPKDGANSAGSSGEIYDNTTPESDNAVKSKLSNGINKFCAKFFAAVAKKNPGKSLVMSPLSMLFAIAPLGIYSTGNTHKQILQALNLDTNNEVRTAFRLLSNELKSQEKVTIENANKVYINSTTKIVESFLEDTKTFFDSEAEKVDFSHSQETADKINRWVEEQTHNNIKDLIPASALNYLTEMVLVNAIYFLGDWRYKFDERNTEARDFHINSNTVIKKQIMYRQGNYRYAESSELDCKVLELPYDGGNFSMYVWLPNTYDGVNDLIEKSTDSSLTEKALSQMTSVPVKVYLPLMNITTSLDLKEPLTECNLGEMFTTNTDFEPLTKSSNKLKVTDALHKAMIEVNEKGTKAAAATGIIVGTTAVMKPPEYKIFNVDHPVIYQLKYKNTIFFNGIYVQ